MNKINRINIWMFFFLVFLCVNLYAERYYVKSDGMDESSGTSWNSAFGTLSKAATATQEGDEVWVASGTYQAGAEIIISKGVSFYGGFTGNESLLSERNPIGNPSIIDGNEQHRCVTNKGILDGFHVINGKNPGFGGGINNIGSVINCWVYNNLAMTGGGIHNSVGTVINCAVYSNLATERGGGIFNECSSGIDGISYGVVINSTIYGNIAGIYGGGICNFGKVINTISWKNQGGDIVGRDKIQNCCYGGPLYENGNFSANPLFENTSGDFSAWDFHLKDGSPCIDTGTSETAEIPDLDIEGKPRPGGDGRICIGAYESPEGYLPGEPEPPKRFYVKPGGGDHYSGESWMEAFSSIKKALSRNEENDSLIEVWVADWNYQQGETLVIPSSVSLYGGFSGTETQLDQRDIFTNKTIIDGDNAWSCAMNFGVMDGLYITKGMYNKGGGIHNYGLVMQCTVYNNNADSGAGIFNMLGKVMNSRIYGNTAAVSGGGIHNIDGQIVGTTLNKNSANNGGGISNSNNGYISGCAVYNNKAEEGGGIYNTGAIQDFPGTVENCIVYGNEAVNQGGGISNNDKYGIVRDCAIYGNQAGDHGGGIYNQSGQLTHSRIFHNKVTDNNSTGGGVYNYYGKVENIVVYGNQATAYGGGVYNDSGPLYNITVMRNRLTALNNHYGVGVYNNYPYLSKIQNSIVWDNPPNDLYYGSPEYCCFGNAFPYMGNFALDPGIINGLGDFYLMDFHLREDSPCIDAGNPDSNFEDGFLPPGLGTTRNDMGVYGGPKNDGMKVMIPPKTVIGVIKELGDAWGAENHGIPPLDEPIQRNWLGFRYNPVNSWYILTGDADRMGLDDLIQITQYGDAWVSPSLDTKNQSPTRWGWLGFGYKEYNEANGWLPLAGDVNGDGACDLVQVTSYGDAWVALSDVFSFKIPVRYGWLGYRFKRGQSYVNGALPLMGDANGDGRCDLIQITEYTDAWVAVSSDTLYLQPERWGWLGFKYAPFDGWYPLCGDVNADGRDDLVQITPTGDPWVSLSKGSSFDAPTRWGWLNFYYNEGQGYYPMLGDINSDGMDDLIQITPSGEVWVASSLGDHFDYPEYWGSPGFPFSRENGYLPFFLNL
jgi:hypothetical protein